MKTLITTNLEHKMTSKTSANTHVITIVVHVKEKEKTNFKKVKIESPNLIDFISNC